MTIPKNHLKSHILANRRLQNRAGLNQLMVLGVEQAVKVVVISHILGAIWYYYGCYDCDELNWTRELSDHVFQKDNPFDWFIISYTATGGMLQHLAKGNVSLRMLIKCFCL